MRRTSTLSGRRARNGSSRPAEAGRSTLATTRDPRWQEDYLCLAPSAAYACLDEGDPTEIGILCRARLKLASRSRSRVARPSRQSRHSPRRPGARGLADSGRTVGRVPRLYVLVGGIVSMNPSPNRAANGAPHRGHTMALGSPRLSSTGRGVHGVERPAISERAVASNASGRAAGACCWAGGQLCPPSMHGRRRSASRPT